MEILLVIATVFLALITGFYTSNLSRITVYDKRYKIYESLLFLVQLPILQCERKVFEFAISHLNNLIEGNKLSSIDAYEDFYGEHYRKFVFNIESARFLLSDCIYRYLLDVKHNADIVKDYITDMFEKPEMPSRTSEEVNGAFTFFSSQKNVAIADMFLPYLKYEENICKYFMSRICPNWY